jgi:hypothetical protein
MGSLYSLNIPETIKAVVRAIEGMIERERRKNQTDDSATVTYESLMTALGINSNDTARRRLLKAQELRLIDLVVPEGGLGKTSPRRYRVLVPSVALHKRRVRGVFPAPIAVREAMQHGNFTDYTGFTACSEGEGVALYRDEERAARADACLPDLPDNGIGPISKRIGGSF